MKMFTFRLDPLPPFRLDLTAWVLRRRPTNLIDRFEDGVYSRTLVVNGRPLEVDVSQEAAGANRPLVVKVKGEGESQGRRSAVKAMIERLLGTSIDLTAFYAMAGRDERLQALVRPFRGVKPPRFPTVFEGLVNAIACQQLSLSVGILLLNRLSAACGAASDPSGGGHHAFPGPQEILTRDVAGLRAMGFSVQKARSLLEAARAVAADELRIEELPLMTAGDAVRSLQALRGVGRWTAEYVMLRGVGELSIFPGDDSGAAKKLGVWLGFERRPSYEAIEGITARWQPFAGLVYFHLLLTGLAQKGLVA